MTIQPTAAEERQQDYETLIAVKDKIVDLTEDLTHLADAHPRDFDLKLALQAIQRAEVLVNASELHRKAG